MLAAFAAVRAALVPPPALDDAADVAAAALDEALGESLATELHRTVVAAGTVAAKMRVRRRAVRHAKVALKFDKTNPLALAWAKAHAGERVTGVSQATREAINRVVTRGFEEGRTPDQIARDLRNVIGLSEREADAVFNLRSALEDADAQDVYAGGRRISVPEGGLSDSDIEAETSRYSEDLVDYRADMIAHDETMDASNEGQRQLWEQGIESGYFTDQDRRVWITSPVGACPVCEEMDGQLAEIDGTWELPDNGGEVENPSDAHNWCRCGQGLVLGSEG